MTNNPTYLKQQYQKLNKKLKKAFTTGRFYQYTQYKQHQLLNKLTSYTLQLKKLGIAVAVAVGAGIGMATPAVGQVPFAHRTGLDNPIDTFKSDFNTFVDIDGDGDLDVVGVIRGKSGNKPNYFYENIGTATNPSFIEGSPIFGNEQHLHWTKFVDIDGDGDMDCFMSAGEYDSNTYLYEADGMKYYENTGTATTHNFVLRTGSANPLDSLNFHTDRLAQSSISFGDLDGDGDLDAYHESPAGYFSINPFYLYYENTGTATNPVFLKNDAANPLGNSSNSGFIYGGGLFYDQDRDGDLDYLSPRKAVLYRNTGTATSPIYVAVPRAQGPYSQIDLDSVEIGIQLVDIDGDGDLDMFGTGLFNNINFIKGHYENIALPSIIDKRNVIKELNLKVFPNPTTGVIQLEQPLTGILEVFNTLGQVLHTAAIEEEQQIELGHLDNGNYFIKIQTAAGMLNKKIVLQK